MAIRLSKPQSKAFCSTAPSVGVCAGFGSGKTYIAIQKAFDLLFSYPGIPVAYGAPTYDLINSIWYPAIEKHCLEHEIDYNINYKKNFVVLPGLGTIICRSLSDPDRIVGWECGSAIIDEFDLLRTDLAIKAWRKMKARCRIKYPKFKKQRDRDKWGTKRHPNQMFAVSTPEGFKAFYHLFEEEPLPGSELIRMSTYSNQKNLPEDYIKELMANYPPQLVKAYIQGYFVNLNSGQVYPNFSRELNKSNRIIKENDTLHIGMDFNVNQMAATTSVIDTAYREIRAFNDYGVEEIRKVPRLYPTIVDELYQIRDTPKMIEAINERYNRKKHAIIIYPDASGKNRKSSNASETDIALLRQAGFEVMVNERNPFVKDRILSVNAMFENAKGERRLKINVIKAPKTTKCVEQQAYDVNGQPDKQKDIDHLPDTVGYFINQRFAITKPVSSNVPLPF